jgi:hypothetical protein
MRHRRLIGPRCHALALQTLLTDTPSVLFRAEQQLLNDGLDRLVTSRSQATGGLQPAHVDRERVRDQA